MTKVFGLRLDWRVMVVALACVVTLSVLVWTLTGRNQAQTDSELSGVTTGISPANTVYPPRSR